MDSGGKYCVMRHTNQCIGGKGGGRQADADGGGGVKKACADGGVKTPMTVRSLEDRKIKGCKGRLRWGGMDQRVGMS